MTSEKETWLIYLFSFSSCFLIPPPISVPSMSQSQKGELANTQPSKQSSPANAQAARKQVKTKQHSGSSWGGKSKFWLKRDKRAILSSLAFLFIPSRTSAFSNPLPVYTASIFCIFLSINCDFIDCVIMFMFLVSCKLRHFKKKKHFKDKKDTLSCSNLIDLFTLWQLNSASCVPACVHIHAQAHPTLKLYVSL